VRARALSRIVIAVCLGPSRSAARLGLRLPRRRVVSLLQPGLFAQRSGYGRLPLQTPGGSARRVGESLAPAARGGSARKRESMTGPCVSRGRASVRRVGQEIPGPARRRRSRPQSADPRPPDTRASGDRPIRERHVDTPPLDGARATATELEQCNFAMQFSGAVGSGARRNDLGMISRASEHVGERLSLNGRQPAAMEAALARIHSVSLSSWNSVSERPALRP
jgi:hypothetical protein